MVTRATRAAVLDNITESGVTCVGAGRFHFAQHVLVVFLLVYARPLIAIYIYIYASE